MALRALSSSYRVILVTLPPGGYPALAQALPSTKTLGRRPLPLALRLTQDLAQAQNTAQRLREVGAGVVISQDWAGLFCADHPGRLAGETCRLCQAAICSDCRLNAGGQDLCHEHARRRASANSHVRVRQLLAVLAFALFLFGLAELRRADQLAVESGRTVHVGVFQFAPESARLHPLLRSFNGLGAKGAPSFAHLEQWFSDEKARYGRSGAAVELDVVAPWFDGQRPPELALPDDGPLRIAWRSMSYVHWFKAQLRAHDLSPRDFAVKLYVIYLDAGDPDAASHSRGSAQGRLAVAHVALDEQNPTYALITLGHELCHALGASDKYDPGSYLASYPQGYVEPYAEPLYPQRFAEVMAVDRPLSMDVEAEPQELSQVRIGHRTAAEMGWISPPMADWFYTPEQQDGAIARLPDQ